MRVTFRKRFERDLRKIRDQSLRQRVQETIERIEAAETSQAIPNLEPLSDASGYGRIRIGEYRIGIAFEGDEIDLHPLIGGAERGCVAPS